MEGGGGKSEKRKNPFGELIRYVGAGYLHRISRIRGRKGMGESGRVAVEVMNMAMEMEKEGLRLYSELAAKTKNELGRKVFLSLAEDEKKHMEIFAAMCDDCQEKEKWSDEFHDATAVKKVPVFGQDDIQKLRYEEMTQDVEALSFALGQENRAIEFFRKVLDETDDPDARQILEKVLEQEEGHALLLQGEIDYLTNSCFWFDFSECRLEAMD
jgi:rubrerythrin